MVKFGLYNARFNYSSHWILSFLALCSLLQKPIKQNLDIWVKDAGNSRVECPQRNERSQSAVNTAEYFPK